MTQPNPSTAMARVVFDELTRGGLRLVVVSPGSRSGALAIAASDIDGVETKVMLDERSAAFYALGRAKATGRPTALVCTSGTAVANYLPAVVEASTSLTPLFILSADRPDELHGVGANQTIDQVGVFGDFVRLGVHFDAPTTDVDGNTHWRSVVCDAIEAAVGTRGPAGPVHLNLAFREPTVPVSNDGRTVSDEYRFSVDGRPAGARWISAEPEMPGVARIDLPPTDRALVIAGDGHYDRPALLEAAATLGWPLLATAASGLRGSEVGDAYEWLLAKGVPGPLVPEVTYVIGGIGPSHRLEHLAASATVAQVRIDAEGREINPSLNATAVLAGDPVATLRAHGTPSGRRSWAQGWDRAQAKAADDIGAALRTAPVSGPATADTLNRLSWDLVVAASSLPIRDVDSTLRRSGRLVANRGASGIDGIVSTALGASSTAQRSVALVGDLSLLHDSNGLLASEGHDLVFVVVNNGGGGLFDLLPQAAHAPRFDELFIARQHRDLARLAAFHGIPHVEADTTEVLESEVAVRLNAGGVHLVEVKLDRAADVAARRELDRIGSAILASEQA